MTTSEPQSLAEAALVGRLESLEALRSTLARSIDSCDSLRDLSSLSARFQAVLAEIDEIRPPEKKGDTIDEIAARRASRGSSASTSPPRTRGGAG